MSEYELVHAAECLDDEPYASLRAAMRAYREAPDEHKAMCELFGKVYEFMRDYQRVTNE